MYILKADTTSKNLTAQRLLARLGPVLFLALLTIANVPDFRRGTRHKKSLTKFVRETPDYAGTTMESVRNRRNALRSSHESFNGSRWQKRTMNLRVSPMKSPVLAQQFVQDARSMLRLEKDAALASRRSERHVKKSSGEQDKTRDYTDALKLAKITVLLCGSNAQR